jgi:hypothetical protein
MKEGKKMSVLKRFAFMCLALIFVSGCYTQTPKPATYEYSTQQKMQAAHHWDLLAEDVAGQVRMILTKVGYLSQPVFVEPGCNAPVRPCHPHNETPFEEGFYELLLTQLVNYGINVTTKRDGALIVANKVQVLYHRENRITRTARPGIMTAVSAVAAGWAWIIRDAREYGGKYSEGAALTGAGVTGIVLYDIISGMFTKDLPHTEIIVTTSIKDYDRYLMRKTDIYYINDLDYWHYKAPPPAAMVEVTDS